GAGSHRASAASSCKNFLACQYSQLGQSPRPCKTPHTEFPGGRAVRTLRGNYSSREKYWPLWHSQAAQSPDKPSEYRYGRDSPKYTALARDSEYSASLRRRPALRHSREK